MRKLIPVTLAVGAVAVVGLSAGVASASASESRSTSERSGAVQPEPPGPRVEFVCANLEQIQTLQADHAQLITDRLALLDKARAAAEASGDAEALERIERRIARLTERQAKVAQRQERLTTFAAENC